MLIIPNSKIKLIKNPLKLDSNNEMMFATTTAQYNYFVSLPKLEFDNLTYIRKDGVLRIETDENLTYEDLLEYNFCMYQNTHYDNKWFYAFISEVTWVNPSVTEMKLETAYFQTWQFDLTYYDSFIEREHVNDDTIGKHTIAENLETGEYICVNKINLSNIGTSTYICTATTELPDEIDTSSFNTRYNGIYSGCKFTLFDTPLGATNFLRAMDALGKGTAINSVFLVPQSLCGTPTFRTINIPISPSLPPLTTHCAVLPNSDSAVLMASSGDIAMPTTIDGYTPKNNKMFIAPFNYFYVSNNIGNDVEFHYEDFINNTPSFKVMGAITEGCSIKAVPLNYKKLADTIYTTNSYNYGVVGAKFPICNWISDSYTNWLTQNGINIAGTKLNQQEAAGLAAAGSIIIGTALLASGVSSVAGAGMILGGLGGIYSSTQANYQHDMIPPQAKGSTSSGDVTYSTGNADLILYKMQVRSEYAKICDSFLSMFGYKVNRLGTPHLHARTYYDYIKTNEANIEGNVPEHDLIEIRKMFNNGIRFWHDTTKYLDFSVTNSIIT